MGYICDAQRAQVRRGGGEHQRGASRLGEGAEEISTHTGEVAHIISDLVCGARRVPELILLKAVVVLPERTAPTSAVFAPMPQLTRPKNAMDEPPKPYPAMATYLASSLAK